MSPEYRAGFYAGLTFASGLVAFLGILLNAAAW